MNIQNRLISFMYKSAIVLAACGGIYLLGKTEEGFNFSIFLYYTSLSNLVCAGYFLYAAVKVGHELKILGIKGSTLFSPLIKNMVTVCIVLTLLIYWFVLVGANFSMVPGITGIANLLVHLIVPLMVVFDALLFDKKGRLQARGIVYCLLLPLGYFIFALIVAQCGVTYSSGQHYPYFFINGNTLGWVQVGVNVLAVGVGILILGVVFFGVDYLLGKRLALSKK